ncbi:FixH family protein [Streptosporangium sp. KLBMP 9127]|nr:FixH family protein [Streptosporangium sp. KLBMP 9127]
MNTAAKVGAYALGLALVFGGALGVGNAVGPVGGQPDAGRTADAGQTAGTGHSVHTSEPPAAGDEPEEMIPGGLQVSQNGYTLTPLTTQIKPGEPTDFRFTVTGPDGAPVTDYKVQHDKKLHFIVVSRELRDFQHLHPEQTGDGVWSVKLTLPEAGTYRAFADFAPQGATALTLGVDLYAEGDYQPRSLPEANRTASVDGYTVELGGDLVPGRSSKLTLKVTKDGEPVTDLQPYLGAYGHLVALRAGDLAYLHVHPDGEPGDGKTKPGPEITFYAEVPSRGDYRLFLDFRHAGAVRTAAFTVRAGEITPDPAAPEEHGDHTH